jgi:hypothetical protein
MNKRLLAKLSTHSLLMMSVVCSVSACNQAHRVPSQGSNPRSIPNDAADGGEASTIASDAAVADSLGQRRCHHGGGGHPFGRDLPGRRDGGHPAPICQVPRVLLGGVLRCSPICAVRPGQLRSGDAGRVSGGVHLVARGRRLLRVDRQASLRSRGVAACVRVDLEPYFKWRKVSPGTEESSFVRAVGLGRRSLGCAVRARARRSGERLSR